MASSASLSPGTALPVCFAEHEAMHQLKIHLAAARLRSGLRAYVAGPNDEKNPMIPFIKAEINVCFYLLGIAYALGFQLPTPKLLCCLASLPDINCCQKDFLESTRDLLDEEFGAIQDNAILARAGGFCSWWMARLEDLNQESMISPTKFDHNFRLYLEELSKQHEVFKPFVDHGSRTSATAVTQEYPYWEITDAGPKAGQPSATTITPSTISHQDLRASVVRAISVVDRTSVFVQAAMGRAMEAADRSNRAIASIQHLKDLYQRDDMQAAGIVYKHPDSH